MLAISSAPFSMFTCNIKKEPCINANADIRQTALLHPVGSIVRNDLGTMLRENTIPPPSHDHREVRGVCAQLAEDVHRGYANTDHWWIGYHGF